MPDEKVAPRLPQPAAVEDWDAAWLPEWLDDTAAAGTDGPAPLQQAPDEPAPEELDPPAHAAESDESGAVAAPAVEAAEPAVAPRIVARPCVRPPPRARNARLIRLPAPPALTRAAPLAPPEGAGPAAPRSP